MTDLLFGRYEALAELGRGGMGVVFRGRGLDSGDNVAIKVVTSADPEAIERFERERRLLASFTAGDGFVPLLDSGVQNGRPYVVMPLLTGGTLAARLKKGPLPVAEAVVLVRALARALRGAHEKGVVHRDLKPANVLFDERHVPFVADLGLAKHFRRDLPGGGASRSLSATGVASGTVGYMAPEQIDDAKNVTPRSDVFALGAILYECIAGSPPFAADNLVRYARALKETRPPSLRKLGVPRSIDQVCVKALSFDARERYADAGAMERALALAQASRRTPLAVVASVSVVLLVAATLVFARRTPARSLPPPAPVAPVATTSRKTEGAAEIGERAMAKAKAGDLDAALADLDRALALDPRDARLWMHRGDVRDANEDRAGAMEDYDHAIALAPSLTEAWASRGSARAQAGDPAGGRADLDHALELDSRSVRTLFFRSILRYKGGDVEGALADLDRALEIEPDELGCLVDRAELRRLKGDLEGEMADLDHATRIEPPHMSAFLNRGIARQERGDKAGAIQDYERALELGAPPERAEKLRGWIRTLRRQ